MMNSGQLLKDAAHLCIWRRHRTDKHAKLNLLIVLNSRGAACFVRAYHQPDEIKISSTLRYKDNVVHERSNSVLSPNDVKSALPVGSITREWEIEKPCTLQDAVPIMQKH